MGAKAIVRIVGRRTSELARRVRPDADLRAPGERSLLDDVATSRPWNVRVKLARSRARLRRLRPGVTVVVVNWNTSDVTADVIRAAQRLSPPDVRIMLIDNGSTDGAQARFRDWPGLDARFLRSNAGHGVALDLGVCWSRTAITVTLDSDALPLRADWLEPVVEPVRSGRAALAGLRSRRGFAHPVFLAIDTAAFFYRRRSFQVHRVHAPGLPDTWGVDSFDTAELLTGTFDPATVTLLDRTPNPVDGLPGMTVAGVVYHHGGVSRAVGDPSVQTVVTWKEAHHLLDRTGGDWHRVDPT